MGYYTRHELEVIEGDNELISELRNSSECASYAIYDNGKESGECKWYRHEDELRNLSKKHPQALFKLIGEGEDSGDIWIEYYRAGKMQRCAAKITFDKFDCDELA